MPETGCKTRVREDLPAASLAVKTSGHINRYLMNTNRAAMPRQGWASALRDFRALLSCDAEIPKALIQQILQVDEDQYAFLFMADCRDAEGELLALDDAQLQLLYAVGERWHGVVLGNALDAVRHGQADCIDGDWARLVALYQAILDEKASLILQGADLATSQPALDDLNQHLVQVNQAFRELIGSHLQ